VTVSFPVLGPVPEPHAAARTSMPIIATRIVAGRLGSVRLEILEIVILLQIGYGRCTAERLRGRGLTPRRMKPSMLYKDGRCSRSIVSGQ
jgi:hypothetical protein